MAVTSALLQFWTGDHLAANVLIGLNLFGVLLLGTLVEYERSYEGRTAGMRTYGLVRLAATALTLFGGFASSWYGSWTPTAIRPTARRQKMYHRPVASLYSGRDEAAEPWRTPSRN